MNLNRFEPWRRAASMQRYPGAIRVPHRPANSLQTHCKTDRQQDAGQVPAVDIYEEDTRYVLHADLPGVDPADIKIDAQDGTLSISGERPAMTADPDSTRRLERHRGKFARQFALPEAADAESISAKSKNGTLEITIPKHVPKTRRVTIEAA